MKPFKLRSYVVLRRGSSFLTLTDRNNTTKKKNNKNNKKTRFEKTRRETYVHLYL